MQLPLDERRLHLELDTPCLERGGSSANFHGLLAETLNTTMPDRGDKPVVHLCHACGNGKCSNVLHLYWGTAKENVHDAKEHGTWKSTHQRAMEKYGEQEYKQLLKKNASAGGKKGGGSNKFTDEEVHHIQTVISSVPIGYGRISKISKILGVSHTTVAKYIQRWFSTSGSAPSS